MLCSRLKRKKHRENKYAVGNIEYATMAKDKAFVKQYKRDKEARKGKVGGCYFIQNIQESND